METSQIGSLFLKWPVLICILSSWRILWSASISTKRKPQSDPHIGGHESKLGSGSEWRSFICSSTLRYNSIQVIQSFPTEPPGGVRVGLTLWLSESGCVCFMELCFLSLLSVREFMCATACWAFQASSCPLPSFCLGFIFCRKQKFYLSTGRKWFGVAQLCWGSSHTHPLLSLSLFP